MVTLRIQKRGIGNRQYGTTKKMTDTAMNRTTGVGNKSSPPAILSAMEPCKPPRAKSITRKRETCNGVKKITTAKTNITTKGSIMYFGGNSMARSSRIPAAKWFTLKLESSNGMKINATEATAENSNDIKRKRETFTACSASKRPKVTEKVGCAKDIYPTSQGTVKKDALVEKAASKGIDHHDIFTPHLIPTLSTSVAVAEKTRHEDELKAATNSISGHEQLQKDREASRLALEKMSNTAQLTDNFDLFKALVSIGSEYLYGC